MRPIRKAAGWAIRKALTWADVFGEGRRIGSGTGYADNFRGRRAPSPAELIEAFKGTAYACAILNAAGVVSTPLRLFARTGRGQAAPRFWPTRQLAPRHVKALAKRSGEQLVSGTERVDELLEHPFLDVLDSPCQGIDRATLLELMCLYLDITGDSWLHIRTNGLDVPVQLWPLPSHHATIDPTTMMMTLDDPVVEKIRFTGDHWWRDYPIGEVAWIKFPDPKDPWGRGRSPLRAAWESATVSEELLAYEQAMLANNARPDLLITPKDSDYPIGDTEATRLERKVNQKFKRAGAGGLAVFGEAFDVKPLGFPPRDLAQLQIRQVSKEELCNSFGVPVALLKTEDVNRANAEAAHLQHARRAIKPRCERIARALTEIAKRFDERLFVAFDDPVPEDSIEQREFHKTYLSLGALQINEVRTELGYPPIPGGDVTLVPTTLQPLETAVDPPEPVPAPAPGKKPPKPSTVDGAEEEDDEEDGATKAFDASILERWRY